MQVATLFRDNVILLGSENTMNKSPEPAITSLEEQETEATNISAKDTHHDSVTNNNLLPLSVSSTVNIDSTADATTANAAAVTTITVATTATDASATTFFGYDNTSIKTEDAVKIENGGGTISTTKDEAEKKEEKEESIQDDDFVMENSTIEENSISTETISHDENINRQEVDSNVNLSENISQCGYNVSTSVTTTQSPLSSDINELHRSDTTVKSSTPSPIENTLATNESESKECKLNYDDCEASNPVPSSQATTALMFSENESSFKKSFMHDHEHENEMNESSSQTKSNITSSSMSPSNIRETHGCATNNISDMDEMEAENLVIHQHDHSNSVPRKTTINEPEMDHLLHTQKQHCATEEQEMDMEEPLDQHAAAAAHQQQMEFERQQQISQQQQQKQQQQQQQQQQISQQRLSTPEEQSEVADNCAKHNQYSHEQQFHECLRNDLNVEELSQQQNVRGQQHMSQNSLAPNVEDYRKMHQHLTSNINMINQIDHQHQYHHINQNQQHQQLQHQHAQQLYLQHHDQQHMIHHQHHQQQQQQQQHQHHSELMAYLHHQDQQAMQQPHHIRTYQHYQQQQQRMHSLPHPQPQSPHHQQKHTPMTCIDDLMIDEFQDDPNNRYKLLSPTVKHESQDDGYETSAGDVLTPNSHSSSHSLTPQHQIHSTNMVPPKCEEMSTHHPDPDPYNFIDDEINSNMRMMSPSSSNGLSMVIRQQNYASPSEAARLLIEDGPTPMRMENQHMVVDPSNPLHMQVSNTDDLAGDIAIPKKRGRKKKCAEELTTRTMVDGILKPILQKERKKHDRFNGMPEEEVSKRTLPDHLADNLDIIIIGINPGLFAAYKGHHYAGPGNHFWKCLYLSGLTHEQMTAEEDYKLLKFGIGFTNMVERATKGSADLTRKEIKEGSRILLEKLKRFRPKIAVFNGKLIFEVFSGKKDFNFGRQQECVEGTDTYMWVMPSSSARCAQLPRAADKVPFYAALKKFRDYLNGLIPHIDDLECVLNDPKAKQFCEAEPKGNASPEAPPFLAPDCANHSENQNLGYNNSNSSTPERGNNNITDLSTNLNNNSMNIMHKGSPMHNLISSGDNSGSCGMVMPGINGPNPMNLCNSVMHMPCNLDQSLQPEKKKRGRPKKVKGMDGEEGPIPQKVRNTNSLMNNNNILNLTLMGENGETQKKKRGRPKKVKTEAGASIVPCNNSSSISNNGRLSANNPMDNNVGVPNNGKADICLHRNSPTNIGNHQMHTMNNSNQYNVQQLSQQQPLQNQRLFSSPMHSPNTVSSYCPMGMSAPTTPPIGNTNSNNSNLGSSGPYHQQQHGNSHHVQPHQRNHVLQRVQHQLHMPPGMYMPSSNHNPQQQLSKSPHYGSSHSDLSTEISAAISSEHLGESQSVSSPAMGAVDYDRPDSIPNDEHSVHDLRFASPSSNAGDAQQGSGGSNHQIQHYHSMYQNQSSNQAYLSANSNSVLGSTPGENGPANTNDDSINYIVSNRSHTSNSNTSTPQPAQIQTQQQRNMQISDVTSKSLSGLESLVDQIPTIAEGETPNSLSTGVGSVDCRIKSDSNEGYPSPASGGSGAGSSTSGGLGCIYMPSYSNLNSSSPSSPASAAPSNSSILSPHHYPDPIYSTANTCPSSTNTNSNNNINYNGLASNFSVSSLTSNSYPSNSYHSNLMAAAAASSPHHITSTASGSPMYMDPHMPVAVSPIYHHPYAQHAGYGAYSPVGPPAPPPPPTLHMPSPNYPYAYTNTSGYTSQTAHHPGHTTAAGYLTNHPSMFDRIKPDIGYGGY